MNRRNWAAVAASTAVVLLLAVLSVLGPDISLADRSTEYFEPLSPQAGIVLLVAGIVTQFGDPWFLLLVAAFIYLAESERTGVRDSRDGAFVLGVTFAAFSFIDLLKNVFVGPRPPGAGTVEIPMWLPTALGGVFQSITTGSGYAFPSGHALGTTAVFAAIAYKLDLGERRVRWAVAGLGVVLVAGSRVVLGVHFLVDILVGCVAGLCLFAVATTVGSRRPSRVFALGVGLGVLAVLASMGSPEVVWKAGQWLGASLGAGVAWHRLRPTSMLTFQEAVVAGVPIAVAWITIYLTSPPLVVTVLATAVAAGVTVAAPTLINSGSTFPRPI
ncbi:phosphoesterase [Salinigranum rubrum]|uniref:Phosphoesterase n=1 Tax=Salinigranum rubrum TaxID=755307 RepID=A0A2I8VHF2_9EURY|nr:phosphatase PAP2 family protein [Salinigranum rubrum]AUV81355.1 phosphoesterase [Salinigranum rubrum]